MIIPLAHEHMGHRRWPFITIAIIALCFVVHSILASAETQRREVHRKALQDTFLYYAQHPYLKVNPPFEEIRARTVVSRPRVDKPSPRPETEEELLQEQKHFDNLGASIQKAVDGHPNRQYGYVPGRGDVLQIITHQFLHGDWLHLFFNMWFLWLCGVNLEDR